MNKKELLDYLNNEFEKVLTPEEKREEAGVKWYIVGVYDSDSSKDMMRRRGISFYVANEGTTSEVAYFQDGKPKSMESQSATVTTFRDEIETYIADKIADGTIEEGNIERSDEDNRTAIVAAVYESSGNLVENRFLVNEDSGGNLQHAPIG